MSLYKNIMNALKVKAYRETLILTLYNLEYYCKQSVSHFFLTVCPRHSSDHFKHGFTQKRTQEKEKHKEI